ncbi:hypothetical protein DPMN_022494 [Dreissena polymorpha]|uniref:Uncharacterized protein n=1 Tax=Dreissena polymorpha TaxID=45954 RepID=A0A9D4JAZ8_DREPO|nr:hypothetical protein DPMN_133442 [Dreissena polymorpha]KAH3898271.1 hypothetical protein DPMN_022494 [Dreissena polymorpha]
MLVKEPRGACVGPDDTVLVRRKNKTIVHLPADGNILATFHVDMVLPCSICVSKDDTRLALSKCTLSTKKLHFYMCI